MKLYLTVLFILLLTMGCSSTKQQVVKEERKISPTIEYIIKIPPVKLLEIPPRVANIDVEKAKQSDVAQWILQNEERMRTLENMLIEISNFFKNEEDNANRIKNEL
jgi:uncharacterized protein YcfL